MKLKMIANTTSPELLVSAAAKLCYAGCSIDEVFEQLDDKQVENFIDMLVNVGHESPIEHINFTFAVEGISRITEQQLTRHRIASYSIQSGRYVCRDNASFSIPPAIENNLEAKKIFDIVTKENVKAYTAVTEILLSEYMKKEEEKHDPNMSLEEVTVFWSKNKKLKNSLKKKALEDARYLLPNSLQTKIIFSMNGRTLLNFFNKRLCLRAQWEIRELAKLMLIEVKKVAPTIFKNAGPPCIKGMCKEGYLSCKNSMKAKEVK